MEALVGRIGSRDFPMMSERGDEAAILPAVPITDFDDLHGSSGDCSTTNGIWISGDEEHLHGASDERLRAEVLILWRLVGNPELGPVDRQPCHNQSRIVINAMQHVRVKGRIVEANCVTAISSMCGRIDIAELLLAHGADANASVYVCGDSLGHCQAEDQEMADLLRRHGAGLTVEQLPDGEQGRETAKAILAGTMPASSLNVSNPTRTDLAEQMLWATGDSEIVRSCRSYITRARNDPWWNYVLIGTGEIEKLKLILDHGVDPDVIGDGGFTIGNKHCFQCLFPRELVLQNQSSRNNQNATEDAPN